MNQLELDIQRYQGYVEFAQDGLYRCHPNDETRIKAKIESYKEVISALQKLDAALNHY